MAPLPHKGDAHASHAVNRFEPFIGFFGDMEG